MTQETKPAPESDGAPLTDPAVSRLSSYQNRPQLEHSHSIRSVMTDSHYAVLPHGVDLSDWSEEDKELLDDHVRHMLHSKRSKFKQRMRAFGKYISKRRFLRIYMVEGKLTFTSAWLLCYTICLPHHHVRFGLGPFLDW